MKWRTIRTTDAALLDRWRTRRDAGAFTEIVTRHAGMVFATCNRILGDRAVAEEVAQECFLALARGNSEVPASPGGWLHTVAARLALKRVHSDAKRRAREEDFVQRQEKPPHPEWDDIKRYVDEAIEELPKSLQSVVVAHFLEQRSHREIAKELGVTRQAVTYRIRKGISEIRRRLDQQGITLSIIALGPMLSKNALEPAPATLLRDLGRMAMAGGKTAEVGIESGSWLTGVLAPKSIVSILAAISLVAAVSMGILLRQDDTQDDTTEPPEIAASVVTTVELKPSDPPEAVAVIETVSEERPRNEELPAVDSMKIDEAVPGYTGSISGQVVMATDRSPIAGARVTATHSASRVTAAGLKITSSHTRDALTTYDGSFVIEVPKSAVYKLEARLDNLFLLDGPIQVSLRADMEKSGFVLALQKDPDQFGGVLRGRVTEGGKPKPNARLMLTYDPVARTAAGASFPEAAPGRHLPDTVYTDSKGEYFVDHLPTGTLRVNFNGTYIAEIRTGVETVVNFDDPAPGTGVIEGWIVPPEMGREAHVSLWGDKSDHGSLHYGTQADQDGYFVFRDIPATTWQVIMDEKGSFLGRRLIRVQNRYWTDATPDFNLGSLQYTTESIPYRRYLPREYFARYEDARAHLHATILPAIAGSHMDRAFSQAWVRTSNSRTTTIEIDWEQWRFLRGQVTNLMKGETGVAYSFIEDVPPIELDPLRLDMNSFTDALKKFETRQAEFGPTGNFQILHSGTV